MKTPLIACSLLAVAGCMGSRTYGEVTRPESADFTNAAVAEVRNAQGQVILRGTFVAEDDGDGVERKASLAPTGVDADATGEAEVEVTGTGNDRTQEIEFAISKVDPRAVLTLVIDGRVFSTATADSDGRVAFEIDVPLPRT